ESIANSRCRTRFKASWTRSEPSRTESSAGPSLFRVVIGLPSRANALETFPNGLFEALTRGLVESHPSDLVGKVSRTRNEPCVEVVRVLVSLGVPFPLHQGSRSVA